MRWLLIIAILVVCCSWTVTARRGRPSFCYQPPETGRCRAAHPRFFYDPVSGRCRLFTYGGCGGNRNNFMSPRQCRRVCRVRRRWQPVPYPWGWERPYPQPRWQYSDDFNRNEYF